MGILERIRRRSVHLNMLLARQSLPLQVFRSIERARLTLAAATPASVSRTLVKIVGYHIGARQADPITHRTSPVTSRVHSRQCFTRRGETNDPLRRVPVGFTELGLVVRLLPIIADFGAVLNGAQVYNRASHIVVDDVVVNYRWRVAIIIL